MEHRDLLAGFVRLHILLHAARGPVYGQWIVEALGRHGYRLSAGTLYPMLHSMEERGYLVSREERLGRALRRVYEATEAGRNALALARSSARELLNELFEDQHDDERR
jgi:PadR family transcriptional regulator, regulatory protein PadR